MHLGKRLKNRLFIVQVRCGRTYKFYLVSLSDNVNSSRINVPPKLFNVYVYVCATASFTLWKRVEGSASLTAAPLVTHPYNVLYSFAHLVEYILRIGSWTINSGPSHFLCRSYFPKWLIPPPYTLLSATILLYIHLFLSHACANPPSFLRNKNLRIFHLPLAVKLPFSFPSRIFSCIFYVFSSSLFSLPLSLPNLLPPR